MSAKNDGKARYVVDILSKLTVVIAATFGVWQYFAEVNRSRALDESREALQLIRQYSSTEVQEARQVLFDFWLQRAELVAAVQSGKMTERAYAAFLATAFYESDRGQQLNESFYRVAGVFDEVAFCASSSVCNRELVCLYFGPIAGRWLAIYQPLVKTVRARSGFEEFGSGFKRVATECDA